MSVFTQALDFLHEPCAKHFWCVTAAAAEALKVHDKDIGDTPEVKSVCGLLMLLTARVVP